MSNEPQRQELTGNPLQRSDLSLDVAFDVLADGRRRAVISYLIQDERRVDLDELATHVTAVEPTAADGQAAATLHHLHLPKLADAGLISYDGTQQTVVADDSIRTLKPYLEWANRVN